MSRGMCLASSVLGSLTIQSDHLSFISSVFRMLLPHFLELFSELRSCQPGGRVGLAQYLAQSTEVKAPGHTVYEAATFALRLGCSY